MIRSFRRKKNGRGGVVFLKAAYRLFITVLLEKYEVCKILEIHLPDYFDKKQMVINIIPR